MYPVKSLGIVPLVALLSLSGCSKPKPPDDRPYLAQFGLDTPLSMNVSLRQPVDAQGNLGTTGDTPSIALLLHLHAIRIDANASGLPWWTFNATAGTLSDGTLTIPAAKRVITGRTDEKFWSEGGADYYAETISYTIEPLPPFAGLPNIPPMTGSIHLQVRKAPSDDQWHLSYEGDSATTVTSNQDAITFAQTIVSTGTQYEDELTGAIGGARAAAFNQIEKSLADQGIFKRSDADAHVIVSPRAGIAYDTLALDLTNGTYAQMEQFCAGVKLLGYHWRLPIIEELRNLVGADGKLIDVPDGRLWNPIAQGDQSRAILIVANTFVINNGPEQVVDMIDPASLNQYAWAQFLQISPNDHSTAPHQAPIDVRTAKSAPVTAGDPNFVIRVICVASITK